MPELPLNPGALQDTPDDRDFRWEDIGAARPPFDWKAGFDIEVLTGKLPVDDQNGSTSCGGQAFGKYNAVLEAVKTRSFEKSSACYIYNQTVIRDANGNPLGSTLRDNADLVVKQGVALESLCPSYDNGLPPTDAYILRRNAISAAAADSAKHRKGSSYAYVGTHIDLYAQAIRDNHGLVFLTALESNGTWYSAFPKKPTYRQSGHFMFAGKAKLINGKKYIGALQSFGDRVGDPSAPGWQWFGEEYFSGIGFESAVTIVFPDIVPPAYRFTRDLTVGSTGIDVKYLQKYLNEHGFFVATNGPGAPGRETTYFGPLTRTALARFQDANGISPPAGYFGPITRARING